jgi:uncharacterized protein
VVLQGQQVVPTKTIAEGFKFQYPTLQPALAAIVG